MPLQVVETLKNLVRIPSVNPMGRDVSGTQFLEAKMTDHLESLFEQLGVPWERREVEPERSNIAARLDGDTSAEDGGPLIMFEAHQDTVPVDGMTIPPWTPDVRDGRVYGRGSCDIKGGMACMLAAFARLAAERPARMPTIVMACTVNEEYGYSGATKLTEHWSRGDSAILPRAPDAVVVAEPTLLDVVVAHKGVVRWKCHTKGRACHSSQPQRGDNAIYHMARVVEAFRTYAQDVVPNLGQHPLLSAPTLSVGVISGGISVNTVPDSCSIEIDRRLMPDEDPQEAYEHATRYVAEQTRTNEPPVHDQPYITARGLSDHNNGPLAARLSEVARRCGAKGERIGVPFGTDAAAFSPAGVPTVVFGPGSIEQAHTADEWIAIEQLEKATEILYNFAKRGLDG